MVLKAKPLVWIDIDQFDRTHHVFMKFFELTPRSILSVYIHDNKKCRSSLKIVVPYYDSSGMDVSRNLGIKSLDCTRQQHPLCDGIVRISGSENRIRFCTCPCHLGNYQMLRRINIGIAGTMETNLADESPHN